MMIIRHKLLLITYKIFGNFRIIDLFVVFFYRGILVPALRFYLSYSFPELLKMEYRHSLANIQDFNAFLSDIDITLIIKENHDPTKLIQSYLKLKKIFIMLDFPETYTESEYSQLETFKKSNFNQIIDLCWNIRKINWNCNSLKKNPDQYNLIKKNRSILKSLSKILKISKISLDMTYQLEEFKFIDQLIPVDSAIKNICYWSVYLETHKADHLKIMLTSNQFYQFNSLMPGEALMDGAKESEIYLKSKMALAFHELYLCKSSLRLKCALGQNTFELEEWIKNLNLSLGLK